jgi:hypothetical protein
MNPFFSAVVVGGFLVLVPSRHAPPLIPRVSPLGRHTSYASHSLGTIGMSSFGTRPFTSSPAAEAKLSDLEIAEDAALSRLRPIPDGPVVFAE